MKRHSKELITEIRRLRANGKTYREINKTLSINLAKSTLSWICQTTPLPKNYREKITKLNIRNLGVARATALAVKDAKKEEFNKQIKLINLPIAQMVSDEKIAKIALAMLCLGEASKSGGQSSFSLGNSDPRIVVLFLNLLKMCFDDFDPKKIRATIQCRADQNTKKLEDFWIKITRIPKLQFYKPLIDPRTVGKPTKKKSYKGILKIDYLSSKTQLELESLADLIYNQIRGPVV